MAKERVDEEILMTLKKSRRAFVLEYFCGISLLVLIGIIFFKNIKLNQTVSFLVIGLALTTIGSAEIARLVHRCKVTASKLVIIDGLIRQSKKHIYVGAISDINVSQKVIQRLFNYGKIHIKSMSGEGSLEIKDVASPGKRMAQIEEIIERYKNK